MQQAVQYIPNSRLQQQQQELFPGQLNQPSPDPTNIIIQKPYDSYVLGSALLLAFLLFTTLNLAFIIPDLYFAFQNSHCVTRPAGSLELTLRTWLIVDAIMRIIMSIFILLGGIAACNSYSEGVNWTLWTSRVGLAYAVGQLVWIAVGSGLYWGALDDSEECMGQSVSMYMTAFLIVSYIGVIINFAWK